jgi:hypothetical protein
MEICQPTAVPCTSCLWWDWAIGCAEEIHVQDPRQPRACARFQRQDDATWQAWLAGEEARGEGWPVLTVPVSERAA